MTRAGLRKEKTKSIIVTKDREFKRKVIAFLNASAFSAEKLGVETIRECLHLLDHDRTCANVIFDGSPLSPVELKEQLQTFADGCQDQDVRFIVYLNESTQQMEKERALKLVAQAQVFFLPMAQSQFNKSLFGTKLFEDLTATASVSQKPEPKREPPADPKVQAHSKPASLTLIETSTHLKETIDLLNAVSRDKGRIDTVRALGQKFNGLIGTFAFFANDAGYVKLRDMATVVDDISRTYTEDHNRTTITEDHWTLLMESAKTLYQILKDMRDNKPITASYLQTAQALWDRHNQTSDIMKRQSQSQEDIDALIEAEMNKQAG